MNSTQVDGVPVLWEPARGPFHASLVVRMGARDETFLESGAAHLVEHLVMAAVERDDRPVDLDASVTARASIYSARGERAAVLDAVRGMCEALSDLDVRHLERETTIARIESGMYEPPHLSIPAYVRFGMHGLGLSRAPQPALEQLTGDTLREFSRRLAVRGNAVLVLTGPPGDDVHLPLPHGERGAPPVAPPTQSSPGWREAPFPGITIGFEVPGHLRHVHSLIGERLLRRLRFEAASVYSVDSGALRLDGARRWVGLGLDHADGRSRQVTAAAVSEIRALRTDPPTDAELRRQIGRIERTVADPSTGIDRLIEQAVELLDGGDPASTEEIVHDAREHLTPAALRDAFAAVEDSLTVVIPEDDEPEGEPADLTLPESVSRAAGVDVGEATFRRRRFSGTPRDLTVHAGPSGISQFVLGSWLGAGWDDVVGVAELDRSRLVILSGGNLLPLDPGDLARTDELFALLREHAGDKHFVGRPENFD